MESDNSGIFQTSHEKKMLNQPKVNVLGKIDLSSLNQSTRPKKKTKEERRKEREDKTAQKAQGKKKRVRINKERVDINAAANQQGGRPGFGKKNNNNNNKNNAGTGKRSRNNRNQRPLEVDDEAVARQVKETLARLTSKTQNSIWWLRSLITRRSMSVLRYRKLSARRLTTRMTLLHVPLS